MVLAIPQTPLQLKAATAGLAVPIMQHIVRAVVVVAPLPLELMPQQ
jgi:hypothetical protein